MEITEQWVGKAAGGRVLKDARNLVRLGKVLKVKETEGTFQGELAGAKRSMKVVVKVISPTHVKNLCNCSMSRATGAMCEHAAAILLASISKPPAESAAQIGPRKKSSVAGKYDASQELQVLDVSLSPKFPYEGVRAVQLRRAKKEDGLDADYTLAGWMLQNVGKVDTTMLSLPEGKVSSFYRAISGHARIRKGNDRVQLESGVLRPILELELDPDSPSLLWLKLAEGQEGLIQLGDCLAAWDDAASVLCISKTNSSKLAGLIAVSDLLAGDWLQVEARDFVQSLALWAQSFYLPENYGGLSVREAAPSIELEISGSGRALQAQLFAVYGDQIRIPLDTNVTEYEGFPIESSERGVWLLRNVEAEHVAHRAMMRAGFEMMEGSSLMFLRGEDDVIEFLTCVVPSLREKWTVHTEEKLTRVASRLGRIVPNISIKGQGAEGAGHRVAGSGTDWLACDVTWQCEDQVLDRNSVRRLLQSGNRTINLKNGKKAVISEFDANVMEGFLLDTDPRQEAGNFYFSAQQAPYIKRLRAYYGEDSVEENIDVPSLPVGINGVVRDYQREGISWLYQRAVSEGGALLADDMGLGKTLQSLAFISLWGEHAPKEIKGPALVVCPATLVGNWRDEAAKFFPDLKVVVMYGARRSQYIDDIEKADIVITSYALLDRDIDIYKNQSVKAVLLDEASAIRNPDTLAAKAVRKIESPMRVAITGTPVENSVRDLWSIYQFILPGYLGTRDEFKQRYEVPCGGEVPDMGAMQRLRWRTGPFMLRRTKSLVAKDLPPKVESIIWCDPSKEQKEHYEGILRHGSEQVNELRSSSSGRGSARMQMLTVLLRLRQSCCDLRLLDSELEGMALAEMSAKLVRLLELLDEAQRGGHRVLVFSQFTSMLSLIRHELDDASLDYCYLDGSTRDRSAEVDRFQDPDGPPAFLISLKAGGYGLTLTAADTVVLFDPWWNPAVEAQAADRIHRIGQTKPSMIYKFITRGTVEEKILRLQEKKKSIISAATGDIEDDNAPVMSGLSEDELLSLLELT